MRWWLGGGVVAGGDAALAGDAPLMPARRRRRATMGAGDGLGLGWRTPLWPLEGVEAFVLSCINRGFLL